MTRMISMRRLASSKRRQRSGGASGLFMACSLFTWALASLVASFPRQMAVALCLGAVALVACAVVSLARNC